MGVGVRFAAALAVLAGMAPAAARAAPAANDYADPAAWLCRPGRADACSGELTSTVVSPEGGFSKLAYMANPRAPIDCFYVYPTVSREPTGNADMTAGPEELRAAQTQAARFGGVCRVYAPLYRQVTTAALQGEAKADPALAYQDVRDAWNSYLAHDNQGRGVVLIGHSQGSRILVRLIAQEIDGRPVQRRLVSGIVPGTEIGVPAGRGVGGVFAHVPLCAVADQTGCVIGYSTYLESGPPGAGSRFGGDPGKGLEDACVNPARLLGRPALQPELPTTGRVAAALGTTFVENPGVVLARCARTGDRSYLAISFGPGAGILPTSLAALQARRPDWGLHAIDVNLALGDLVEIVARQSAAWEARRGK